MDYFLLSTLRHHMYNLIRLVISYDIACQWCRNSLARCRIYPENCVSVSPAPEIIFLVPKFHLPAHIAACQINYSFNLTPGVGRTDGEAPERGWSDANAMAASTREMGPGSRRDTLDDNFGDHNWQKITSFGEIEAIAWEHDTNFFQLTPSCAKRKKPSKLDKNMSKPFWNLMPLCPKTLPELGQKCAKIGRRTRQKRIPFALYKPVRICDHMFWKDSPLTPAIHRYFRV